MTEKWYDKTADQLAAKLRTDLRNGLEQKEAAARLKQKNTEAIYPIPKASFRSYLKHIITDFMSILLIVAAVIAAVFKKPVGAAVIIGVLCLNYAAAIFTYVKAQRILEGMGEYGLPVAKVARGGKLYLVKQEQVVPGDIIFLSVGDIVPCDARLLEVNDFTVLETSVTSVAGAAEKDAAFIEFRDVSPAAQKNMVFATSIVTRGTAKSVAVATGGDTLVCKMGKNTPIVSHDKLRIHSVLKRYCGAWSLVMIAVVFSLTVVDFIFGTADRTLFDVFLTGISLAVSSMSELYTAFGFIIIGSGIFNAVKQFRDINAGALIKNSSKIESLKDITSLIVPKEGVFSINDMKIERIFANSNDYLLGDNKFIENCSRTIRYALLSTALYGGPKLIENNIKFNTVYSPEEEAIISLAFDYNIYNIELDREYPLLDHLPSSEDCPLETSLVSNNGVKIVAVRGEINALLDRCRYYSENGRVFLLTDDKRDDIRLSASQATRESYRVVGVASKETIFNDLSKPILCQTELTFEGFIALREPLLPGAAKNISKCRAAGIKVIMLCDDISENNLYLAETIGVARNATDIITSAEIKDMKEGLFRANLSLYSVYEGLTVSQKRNLVQYLQESGEVVGVLARRLDEMPLLNDADVGFSQSVTLSGKGRKSGVDAAERRIMPIFSKSPHVNTISGCEALKFISDVIISVADKAGRGGFNAIINAISFAKVIYLNLLRMVRYLIVSQCARGFAVLYSVVTHKSLLTPLQILFCGLIIDFLAVIIIAFERPSSDILKNKTDVEKKLINPLTHNMESVLFGLAWGAVTAILPQILTDFAIITTPAQALTCSFISLIIIQIVILNETVRETSIFMPNISINGISMLVTAGLGVFITICVLFPFIGEIFGIVPIGWLAWLSVITAALFVLIVYELYKLIKHIVLNN